ncbi:MAG TPA: hypothetical protein VGR22_07815 [Thermomicrobiales bacterium]|nr:hypothetical protein [Thermomicrobiales bacterium]
MKADRPSRRKEAPSLFALREGFEHPVIDTLLGFVRRHQLEITGFEFIETADGRLVVYDVNTNTNYNPEVEAVAPRSGPAAIARYLQEVARAASAPAWNGTSLGTPLTRPRRRVFPKPRQSPT